MQKRFDRTSKGQSKQGEKDGCIMLPVVMGILIADMTMASGIDCIHNTWCGQIMIQQHLAKVPKGSSNYFLLTPCITAGECPKSI